MASLKKVKRIIAAIVCLGLIFQTVGCGKKSQQSNNGKLSNKITVWSAPSTVKVEQDDIEYPNKGAAELVYSAVRNEYESRQLVITTLEDVDSYDLEINDLEKGSDVLSKENISVYREHYVYTNHSAYEPAIVPDALIPLDTAREYNELTIEKNTNAALWITIYVPKELPSGVYEGSFKLTVDNKSMNIPVQVKVYDYTLTDEINAKTLFSWRYDRVGVAEFDTTIDMMETYYEFFLDYRISLQSMPMESLSGEEMIAALEKYYDSLTTFCFLNAVGDISMDLPNYKEKFREQIMAVAAASTPERNYFEKAMLYVVDEPDITVENWTRGNWMFDNYEKMDGYLGEFVEEIKNDTTGKYDNFKSIDGWEDYIIEIPSIATISPVSAEWLIENEYSDRGQRLWKLVNCWCPIYDSFTTKLKDDFFALCEKYGSEIWWYGASVPFAPSTTYHIPDKNLLSTRSISWIQHKLDIEGNLYWDAVAYTEEGPDQYINVYESYERIKGNPPGCGGLAYPGTPYGIYGPVTSMRLMSIRDGMEEYEILEDVESGYRELAEKNPGLDVKSLMEVYYETLYDGGIIMYADGQNGLNFETLRENLLEATALLEKDIDFAMYVSGLNYNIATISYFVSEDCKIYIDGNLQQPIEGSKYEYQLDLEKSTTLKLEVESSTGEKYKISRFVSKPVFWLQTFADATAVESITLTDSSSATFLESEEFFSDGAGVYLNVNGVVTGDELQDMNFVPTVNFSTKLLQNISKISDVSDIRFELRNPGDEFTMKVRLYSDGSYSDIGEYTIASGENTVELSIANSTFTKLDKTDRIAFIFDNSADGTMPNSYQLYVDNIVGIK